MAAKFIAVCLVLLAIFSSNTLAQACYTPATEQTIELTHPTDNSSYFLAAPKDFSFKTALNGITTYQRGTTMLVFRPGSFVTVNVKDTKAFANILLSEYNNADTYTKITDLTETTVGTYKAYFLEYKDPAMKETGRVTVIIGDKAETKTKFYILTLRSKDVKYGEDKTMYLKMVNSFGLDPLDECIAPEPPPQDNNDTNQPVPNDNPGNTGNNGNPGNSSDTQPPANPPSSTPNNTATAPPANNEFKILGFDGWLVIGGIVLLLLLLGTGFVILAIIAVIIYFFFIKKR